MRDVIKKHVTPVYLRESKAEPSIQNMASRQSLRLLGMGPELQAFHDICFICLVNLDIASVLRCHVMPCCGKLIHKRCLQKARETSFQCGHCRFVPDEDTDTDTNPLRADESLDESDENTPQGPVWNPPPELRGPTLIERARTAIVELRQNAFAHSIHQPGTRSWQRLPFTIDHMVWYLMWINLDWFISTNPDGPRPLYIHAYVFTPVEPIQLVRKTIYRLINQTIPDEVWQCLSNVFYRIRFRAIAEQRREGPFAYPYNPNEITFTHIRFTRYWSPVEYDDDFPYTTDSQPTPPSSPER